MIGQNRQRNKNINAVIKHGTVQWMYQTRNFVSLPHFARISSVLGLHLAKAS